MTVSLEGYSEYGYELKRMAIYLVSSWNRQIINFTSYDTSYCCYCGIEVLITVTLNQSS